MLHAPANQSFRVPLQPNSLYVATQTIINEDPDSIDNVTFERGLWHWSFFFTDAAGNATQLHWSLNVANGVVGEYFGYRPIPEVRTRTEYCAYVCFCRLSGWISPGLETLVETLRTLWKEHEGKPTQMLRNMSPKHSCRTWIHHAVATFVNNGWMNAAPVDLDEEIVRESKSATDRYIDMQVNNVWGMNLNQYMPTMMNI